MSKINKDHNQTSYWVVSMILLWCPFYSLETPSSRELACLRWGGWAQTFALLTLECACLGRLIKFVSFSHMCRFKSSHVSIPIKKERRCVDFMVRTVLLGTMHLSWETEIAYYHLQYNTVGPRGDRAPLARWLPWKLTYKTLRNRKEMREEEDKQLAWSPQIRK
jgi:hypothetical protein